jgi:8-oxo-dGTP pyrophosphatase MutT (NUDIX family)
MSYLVRVGAIIIDDNTLLIDRNKTSPIFLLPGGIVENETNEEALEREVLEELNVKLKSSKKFKTYRFTKALFHDSSLKSVTYLTEIEGEPSPGSEILEIAWLGKNEYDKRKYNLAPLIRKVIPDLNESGYLHF